MDLEGYAAWGVDGTAPWYEQAMPPSASRPHSGASGRLARASGGLAGASGGLAAAFASFAAARRRSPGDRSRAFGLSPAQRPFPFAFPAALAGVDFGRTAAELDRTFRRHGARTQPCPADLAFHADKAGLAAMATFTLEGDRIARAARRKSTWRGSSASRSRRAT